MKKKIFIILSLISLVFLPTITSFSQTPDKKITIADTKKADLPKDKAKIINSKDLLIVTTWRKPNHSDLEFTGDFSVDKQGDVELPVIGKVRAQGLTLKELKGAVTDKFKFYLKTPEVEVVLKLVQETKLAIPKEELEKFVSEEILSRDKERSRARRGLMETSEGYSIGLKTVPGRTYALSPKKIVYSTMLEGYKVPEYTINTDDLLDVTIWQNPELSKEVLVRYDGKITLLLVGDVQAAGMTTTQLKNEIAKTLSTFVINPQVAVTLKKFGGKRVVVLGEVTSPGVYVMPGNARFLEAIGSAGGFTQKAYAGTVMLTRGDIYNNPQLMVINTADIFARGQIDKNIILEANDIIYVPKTKIYNVKAFFEAVMLDFSTLATTAAIL